jgi:very-short-patch-repair endonuclease
MQELKSFIKNEFQISTFIIDGKEYFSASESASMLGYSNPHDAIIRHCKKDGVVALEIIDSMNRPQTANFITELNLYRLISRSKLRNSKIFESLILNENEQHLEENKEHFVNFVKENTREEIKFGLMLNSILNNLVEFKEQYRVDEFKIDFYCEKYKLAIEYDEHYHRSNKQALKDFERQNYLTKTYGFHFIRIDQGKELEGINAILKYIMKKERL